MSALIIALAPLSLWACRGKGSMESTPDCPQGWDPADGGCEPRLPSTTGVALVADVVPLEDGDLPADEQRALAERFQPALVFAGAQVWPLAPEYCARSGSDLLSYPADDEDRSDATIAVSNADFASTDLSTLSADGVVYQMDCPGDNSGPGYEDASWLTEWSTIQGEVPDAAPFTPIHYAHIAWYDRAASMLLIQYWTWYPFDKFANNHEGDWEHINVVVDLSDSTPELVDVHWFFHGLSMQSFERITRITDEAGGDHVVVFAGGCGEFDGWGGCYSGASYPWPGLYVDAALFVVEDTTPQLRLLHPDEIAVQILPEPGAAEIAGSQFSWLNLEIYFGQWEVAENSDAIQSFGGDEVPPQPVFKGSWNHGLNDSPWTGEAASSFSWFQPPDGWDVIYNPGHDDAIGFDR